MSEMSVKVHEDKYIVIDMVFCYGNEVYFHLWESYNKEDISDTGYMKRSVFSSCSKYNPDTVILVLSVKERTFVHTWRIAFDTISFRTFVILLCLYYVSC